MDDRVRSSYACRREFFLLSSSVDLSPFRFSSLVAFNNDQSRVTYITTARYGQECRADSPGNVAFLRSLRDTEVASFSASSNLFMYTRWAGCRAFSIGLSVRLFVVSMKGKRKKKEKYIRFCYIVIIIIILNINKCKFYIVLRRVNGIGLSRRRTI